MFKEKIMVNLSILNEEELETETAMLNSVDNDALLIFSNSNNVFDRVVFVMVGPDDDDTEASEEGEEEEG